MPRTKFLRVLIAFGVVGTLMGVAVLLLVYRTITAFHAELMQRADAAHDPMLLDAIARDFRTMMLILAAIALAAVLNIAAGIIVLMRQTEQK